MISFLFIDENNRCAEIKIRAECRMGELIPEYVKKGGDRKSNSHDVSLKLSDLGISYMQSYRYQLMSFVPKKEREKYITLTKSRKSEFV